MQEEIWFCKILLADPGASRLRRTGKTQPLWRDGHCPPAAQRSSPGCSSNSWPRMPKGESLILEKNAYKGPLSKQHTIMRWKGQKAMNNRLWDWLLVVWSEVQVKDTCVLSCFRHVGFCDPMHCTARFLCPWDSPGRILEWVVMPFSGGSSRPRDQTHISCVSCIDRWILYPLSHLGKDGPEWEHESSPARVKVSPRRQFQKWPLEGRKHLSMSA